MWNPHKTKRFIDKIVSGIIVTNNKVWLSEAKISNKIGSESIEIRRQPESLWKDVSSRKGKLST